MQRIFILQYFYVTLENLKLRKVFPKATSSQCLPTRKLHEICNRTCVASNTMSERSLIQ